VNELSDQQLLCEYLEQRSDAAFAELVRRHIDVVYSAALRMVCETHTAEDVTQAVFLALSQNAAHLKGHPVLSGWLHCTARNLAAKSVRSDVRRRAREQEAAVMQELLSAQSDAPWEKVAPHLDDALGELPEAERDALLLRYFQKKSAPEMAGILGISDEAAQKRVSRAVEKLRERFAKRGIAIGASGLVVLVSANAVQGAPAGLGTTICAAVSAGTTACTASLIAATGTIAMTTLQKTLITAITAAIAALAGAGIYEAREVSRLHEQNQALQQQQAPLAEQNLALQRERDAATNRLAALAAELAQARKNPNEVLKLRGEVGVLRQENKAVGEKSALNKITSDPKTRKLLRDQQKTAMSAVYSDFVKRLKLSPELTDKFNDLLADNIMDNVDLVTQVLHDGKSQAELDQMFSAADTALLGKVQALLGDDAAAQYKEYTQNLASTLTASQFKSFLSGDDQAKQAKQDQMQQLLQQEIASSLQNAGLPADYQVVPMLNFRNIASEAEGNQSLAFLDGVYERVAQRSSSFLSSDEVASFQTFMTNALDTSRLALTMNRKMMAPISQ
jgi:RNA polymerase sigma factor (sigma-70 family)